VFATDVNDYRLKKAIEFGADAVFGANENVAMKVREHNNHLAPDVIIVCTGAVPAANQALDCAGPGSKIVFFAVPEPGVKLEVPINSYWRNEIKIMTSYGAAPEDLQDSYLRILSKSVRVKGLITHRLPFSKALEAFRIICEAKDSLKVILEPD
jgi:L-iditol 2-dehydrogenase